MTKEKLRQWLKLAEQERDGGKYIIDWPGTFANALKDWPDEPTDRRFTLTSIMDLRCDVCGQTLGDHFEERCPP